MKFETSDGESLHESIEVRAPVSKARWQPVVGAEFQSLVGRKALTSDDSRRVEKETSRILSQCVPPTGEVDQCTGLVIGYVQSGKTLSFTAVTALARDNAYRLVIVLGGTTTNLVQQSYERLTKDLEIDDRGQRIWSVHVNPRPQAETIEEVNRALDSWSSYPNRPERCPTLLLVVMKNHVHLTKLKGLLDKSNLRSVSALVVDDEGDQASLNSKVRQEAESTTYTCIRVLRDILPVHTYLLYTATPQAPLLISRIDMLSPRFADLIEPGKAYIGGKQLIWENSPYIEIIPESELPNENAAPEPPASFKKALRLFFIGVAVGCSSGLVGNRSMMIHPSASRDWHQQYVNWARNIRNTWLTVLKEQSDSPDRLELVLSFEEAYEDLARTSEDLPAFSRVRDELYYAIDQTQIKELNARGGRIPTLLWKRNYSFILVGGMGLDRGFTVEGLTVTYMPRGAGVGNADTIQQRGRFFGYKQTYVGFVRIFLEHSVESAFRKYVIHEQSIRSSLKAHNASGKPLVEWRRAFFLDRSMSPTRSSVLGLDYMRKRSREWIYPREPQSDRTALKSNKDVVSEFLVRHAASFREDDGSDHRTQEQRHNVSSVLSLQEVYKNLLVPLTATGDDLNDYVHILLQIQRELDRAEHQTVSDRPVAGCDVYVMSKGTERVRTVNVKGAIRALLQGRNDKTGYPGDREIRADDRVTIQIHVLQLKSADKKIIASKVPCIAVSVPEYMRDDMYTEKAD